jgi:hypothetical protein
VFLPSCQRQSIAPYRTTGKIIVLHVRSFKFLKRGFFLNKGKRKILCGKSIIAHVIRSFCSQHGNWRFITVFTTPPLKKNTFTDTCNEHVEFHQNPDTLLCFFMQAYLKEMEYQDLNEI